MPNYLLLNCDKNLTTQFHSPLIKPATSFHALFSTIFSNSIYCTEHYSTQQYNIIRTHLNFSVGQ